MIRFSTGKFLVFSYLLLTVLFVKTAHAEVNNLFLENLSVEHGLSQGSIKTIFQDDEGFIWVGTANGLNMYDGYTFRSLPGPDNDFDHYATYSMIQDKDKLLWLNIAEKGLITYNKKTDTYQKILATDPLNKDYNLVDMVEGNNDDFLIASAKTIILYNKVSQEVTHLLDLSGELSNNNDIHEILLH
ncbi:MAG: two-component regulator propeller domain-containing protein, partial [Colwellia sp.]